MPRSASGLGRELGRRKTRKTRDQHPGVQLREPRDRQPGWVARYRDPETGRMRDVRLDPPDALNADTRLAFAKELSRSLKRRQEDIQKGATPHRAAATPLADAIQQYFDGAGKLVDKKTATEYRAGADAFLAWCDAENLTQVRQLTVAKLIGFPEWCAAMKRQSRKHGGKRGEMQMTDQTISRWTANKHIGSMKTVLNHLRRKGVVRLTSDEIADALRKLKAPQELKPFLRPQQIRRLLDACAEHDALTFKLDRKKNTDTPRYPAIREFVEFMLFTGARLDEALKLLGSDVHAEQHEIHVRAEIAKWDLARIIDLSFSETLMRLAKKMGQRERLFALTEGQAEAALRRIIKSHKAPKFSWHTLRRTCGTFMACTPQIGPWSATKQLGHRSMATTEKHYLGRIKIKPEVKTLEQAMQI
jgi:integrase